MPLRGLLREGGPSGGPHRPHPMALERPRRGPRAEAGGRVTPGLSPHCDRTRASPPSLPTASPGSSPKTKSTETGGVPPHLAHRRRPGRASPRLTLYGGGGTNQGATSPFRFEAPDARLTPRAPRALIGCARRRSGREGRAGRGLGGEGGGEVVAGTLEAPLAPRPCSGARPPSFPPPLVLPSVRAEGCDRPACLAP